MAGRVRNWLPANALERGPARAQIAEMVEAWSREWFIGPPLTVTSLQVAMTPPVSGDDQPWRTGRAAALRCSPRAARRLVDRALGQRRPEPAASEADRTLLEAFEQRLLDDLILRLDAALGTDDAEGRRPTPTARDPFGGDGGALAQLGEPSGESLATLALPLDRLLALAPRTTPRRPRPAPARMAEALAPLRLNLEASLGRVELTLPELRGMAEGDILVLDTLLKGSAELVLADGATRVAKAELVETEGRMALSIQV